MATETNGSGSGQYQPQPKDEIQVEIWRVRRADGPWLHNIKVRMFLDSRRVGWCDAKLIKEEEYTSATQHFFSAMANLGNNTMGDLAQLLLWSENRWIFGRKWQGMLEYPNRILVQEVLDEETRQCEGWAKIRGYFTPVLYKPREGTWDHLPLMQKTQWVLLFTDIEVAKGFRGRGIDSAMVRVTLARTRFLAKQARRHLLAAVEPGCVQFKRLRQGDPEHF